jgi:ketosteroid isomerase-like protein
MSRTPLSQAIRLAIPLLTLTAGAMAACARPAGDTLGASERAAIADTLQRMIVDAYDITKPGDKVARMMSLYAPTGGVVSASAGRVTVSRDSLEAGIRAFWEFVGQNMRDPKWQWDPMHVDVLSPDAAVVTATYRVPHLTPRGMPHVIAGALTQVFARRGGHWVVVQEHLSDVPAAEMNSSTAATSMPGMDMSAGHQH